MKNRGLFALFALSLLLLVVLTCSANAEIVVSQPSSLYNLGDEFNTSISIIKTQDTSGFVSLSLECNSGSIEFYKSPVSVRMGQQKNIAVSTFLDKFVTGNLTGDCVVSANYADENARSRTFEISRDVSVNLNVQGISFNPGDKIEVKGNAIKKNGRVLNGFAEIQLAGIGASSLVIVSNGQFNSTFTLPEDIPAGTQNVRVEVYEKDSNDEVINEGSAESQIRIAQVARRTAIAFNKDSFNPGEELTYTTIVYDQTDDEMPANSEIIIEKPDGSRISTRTISTGIPQKIYIESNRTPGAWKIRANTLNLSADKQFYVEAVEKVSFELLNATLVISNTGNVLYNKPVEVKIGDRIETIPISLNVGESKRFRLGAPDGRYDISVDDGNANAELGSVFLTGKAVSVSDEKKRMTLASSLSWTWAIILIVLGVIAIIYYRRISKKDYVGSNSVNNASYGKKRETGIYSQNIESGEKQKAVIVSVKIKNMNTFKSNDSSARDAMKKAFDKARTMKVKIVQSGEHFVIICTKMLTHEEDNSVRAVKVANMVRDEFDAHNKKYAQKIEYGIGVHSGDIIAEMSAGQFKFNPLGNTVSYAKKMSDSANTSVYLSNPVHSLTRAKVKVERVDNGLYWKAVSVKDDERHSAFINKFMERQGRS